MHSVGLSLPEAADVTCIAPCLSFELLDNLDRRTDMQSAVAGPGLGSGLVLTKSLQRVPFVAGESRESPICVGKFGHGRQTW